MSPQELQGKYASALKKVGGQGATSPRHRPIFQRNAPVTEEQAIQEAANALTALWNVRKRKET